MNIYADLFVTFVKIGSVTFGGGYAMLPILQRDIVQGKKWATDEELMDYYAVGQCTPGIIAVNTATFVGEKQKGVLGGIVATLGLVFPSFVIISIIAAFLQNFSDLDVVKHAFSGIRACVCVLVLNSVIKLRKSSVIDSVTSVIFFLTFILSAFCGVSPILVVLISAAVGLVAKAVKRWKK